MAALLRKTMLMQLVIAFLLSTGVCGAQEESVDQKAIEMEKKRAQIKAVKDTLEGTTWLITLTLTGAEKKTSEDTLIFEGGKVRSKKMVDEGFPQSNFSVRIKDKLVVWETMQTSEKNGIAFWRGEIEQEVSPIIMRGVLSHQIDEKTTKDYYFFSEEKPGPFTLVIKEGVPQAKPPAPPAPAAQTAPVVQPPATPVAVPQAPKAPVSEEPKSSDVQAATLLKPTSGAPAASAVTVAPTPISAESVTPTPIKGEAKKPWYMFWKR